MFSHQGSWKSGNVELALSDNSGWAQSQYYSTIHVNQIHINGREQLILSARGAGGVYVSTYDPVTNAWSQFQLGFHLSDASGWADPKYYVTLRQPCVTFTPVKI